MAYRIETTNSGVMMAKSTLTVEQVLDEHIVHFAAGIAMG